MPKAQAAWSSSSSGRSEALRTRTRTRAGGHRRRGRAFPARPSATRPRASSQGSLTVPTASPGPSASDEVANLKRTESIASSRFCYRRRKTPRGATVGAGVTAAPTSFAPLSGGGIGICRRAMAGVGSTAPRSVREFRKFIRRGMLAHGFARVRGRPLSVDVLEPILRSSNGRLTPVSCCEAGRPRIVAACDTRMSNHRDVRTRSAVIRRVASVDDR